MSTISFEEVCSELEPAGYLTDEMRKVPNLAWVAHPEFGYFSMDVAYGVQDGVPWEIVMTVTSHHGEWLLTKLRREAPGYPSLDEAPLAGIATKATQLYRDGDLFTLLQDSMNYVRHTHQALGVES